MYYVNEIQLEEITESFISIVLLRNNVEWKVYKYPQKILQYI